jgi:oligopeptidase B
MAANDMSPPVAEQRAAQTTYHGDSREDVYKWLKDERWQEVMRDPDLLAPEIRAYLDAENAYTAAAMSDTHDLQRTLYGEMRGRIKEDDSSVPAPDGPFAYYVKYVEGGQHPVFCRHPIGRASEEMVLLDGDAEASEAAYYKIGAFEHSPDHSLAAIAEDRNGSEIFTLRFARLGGGDDISETIDNVSGDVEWAEDGKTIFYTVLDDNHRPSTVFRHVIGTSPKQDSVVYEEADPGFFVGLAKTESRKLILIDAHDHVTSEVHMIPADQPDAAPVLIAAREAAVEYDVGEHNGKLVIRTNADDAEDFKIVTTPMESPGRENWQDMIAHKTGTLLNGFAIFADFLVRLERVDALPRIVIRDWSTSEEHSIALDEEAYSLGLSGSYEYATDVMRFSYSSPTTPGQFFDYNMRTRARTLLKTDEVPSGHDPADYVARRIQANAHDGEKIPVTLVYRSDLKLGPETPILLYGYGSYGMSMPASFVTNRLSLVDRGFVYAIAHIRGGMEKGYRWYKNGRTDTKKNTFDDFIAAAEALIDAGIGKAGGIAIHGGSAGGMLMGACTNMRPDLWRAVVADVPFVDVLNTMCDTSLPLTPIEWPEWGNPIEDPKAYAYIKSYSPYDNVAAKDYPAILATAGLTDPRVTYWEPAKWVAKLRATKTDSNPLLLKTNMDAGHAGAAGRFDRLEELAFNYAFVLKTFGIAK